MGELLGSSLLLSIISLVMTAAMAGFIAQMLRRFARGMSNSRIAFWSAVPLPLLSLLVFLYGMSLPLEVDENPSGRIAGAIVLIMIMTVGGFVARKCALIVLRRMS